MERSLVRILVILVLAAGAGIIRARDLDWRVNVTAVKAEKDKHQQLRETVGITLDEFKSLIDQGALVIDARPAAAYEDGHLDTGYAPPVLNVPADELGANIERLMQFQGYPIVLYCTSLTCDYAEDLYIEMEAYGFHGMKIFFPGWEGIKEAGLPTATGPDTWSGFDQPMQGDDPNNADPGATEGNAP